MQIKQVYPKIKILHDILASIIPSLEGGHMVPSARYERSIQPTVTISPRVLGSLVWWTKVKKGQIGIFLTLIPKATIVIDVFLLVWGAHMGDQMAQADRTLLESRMYINSLELQVVHWACSAFFTLIWSKYGQIMSDSMTTAFYINKQGGTSSLCA